MSEFDIDYRPRAGESKLSSFSDGWRHLKLLLVNSPTALFMVPGLAMLVLGLLGIALSLSGASLFGREWQIHATIAAALLTVVGAQAVALALSARAFAVDVLGERPDRLLAWGRERCGSRRSRPGGLLALAGLAIGGVIAGNWNDRGFGKLSEDRLIVFAGCSSSSACRRSSPQSSSASSASPRARRRTGPLANSNPKPPSPATEQQPAAARTDAPAAQAWRRCCRSPRCLAGPNSPSRTANVHTTAPAATATPKLTPLLQRNSPEAAPRAIPSPHITPM